MRRLEGAVTHRVISSASDWEINHFHLLLEFMKCVSIVFKIPIKISDGNLENWERAMFSSRKVNQNCRIKPTGVLVSSLSLKIRCSSAFGDSFSTSSHSLTSPFSRTSMFQPDISLITGKHREPPGESQAHHRIWLSQGSAGFPFPRLALCSWLFAASTYVGSWFRGSVSITCPDLKCRE